MSETRGAPEPRRRRRERDDAATPDGLAYDAAEILLTVESLIVSADATLARAGDHSFAVAAMDYLSRAREHCRQVTGRFDVVRSDEIDIDAARAALAPLRGALKMAAELAFSGDAGALGTVAEDNVHASNVAEVAIATLEAFEQLIDTMSRRKTEVTP